MVTNFDSEAQFSVRYEGEAVDAHLMDVRDLAPALIAIGRVFDRANELLNGEMADVQLSIRAAVDQTVAPVRRPGISRIVFAEDDTDIEEIDQSESESFEPVWSEDENDEVVEFEVEQWLVIHSPALESGYKWRLHNGAGLDWYSIDDKAFLRGVETGRLRFGSGDRLKCRVLTIQSATVERITADLRVVQVLEFRQLGRQLRLQDPDTPQTPDTYSFMHEEDTEERPD